jgi:Flp pilus assembly protein TadD
MMNRIALNIAASTLALSLGTSIFLANSAIARSDFRRAGPEEARQLHSQAIRSVQQGKMAEALTAIERAVELSPRDAGYRLMLADVYLKLGRFEAARTTYADVLELDPPHVRAGLSYALMQVALGRPHAAIGQLDDLAGRGPAADVGLAYALAGVPERAIEILEPAARQHDATPRLRQNLALSYALSGNWQRARAVAAQDVSPAELPNRLQQWASLARPGGHSAQVASLLGVTPAADSGQPVRLALIQPAAAPLSAPTQAVAASVQTAGVESASAREFAQAAPILTASAQSLAQAAPVLAASAQSFAQAVSTVSDAPVQDPTVPVQPEGFAAAPANIVAATAEPVRAVPAVESEVEPSWWPTPAVSAQTATVSSTPVVPVAQPVSADDAEVRFAASAETLTRPNRAILRTASVTRPSSPVFRPEAERSVRPTANGRFVVQIGAFRSEANAERAWQEAERAYALGRFQPTTTTINLNGRTLHRASISGFASSIDAGRICASIKARGGSCFVRVNAGDAAIRWAARYVPDRSRRA